MEIRRLLVTKDVVYSEAGRSAPRPITRAIALAVIHNPFAGRHVEDLSPLFDVGAQLAKPMRATLDLPLGHKDNPWSFEHFETVTVGVADAPRPDEIVVAIGIADGGRVNPRVGKQRIL
jgi:hypothetical protein